MRYSIRTITAPGEIPLPFTVAEAKAHLRVEASDTSEDELIKAMLRSAADHVERFTSQVLSTRQMEMALDGFPVLPELILIPRTPVTAIGSVKYTDATTGGEVTVDPGDYRWTDTDAETLRPAWGAGFPSAASERGSVRIRFTAGYGAGLVPPGLLAETKKLLTHLYDNRTAEGGMPDAIAAGLRPFRRILI